MLRRLRLHYRIVIPFVLVALVTTSAVAYLALSVMSRALAARVETQLLNTSGVVSQNSGFALNSAILRSVKAITGADVITFVPGGAILAATIDEKTPPDWVAAVTAPDVARESISDAGSSRVRRMSCGAPCYVVYRSVPAKPGAVIALIAETSELAAATAAITRTILAATGIGLLVMMLVSQAVARRVTAPMEDLVKFTHDVSAGDSRRRARAGDDEVGRLGASFNEMLDRLEQSRDALVKSEKLALAGLLAARVAHDIRNPLSSIKMQAQLLRARLSEGEGGRGKGEWEPGTPKAVPGDDGRRELDAILHDIDLVESVIRGLLELAKPGELRLRQASLNDVVRDVLHQLSPQLAYQKIRTSVALDETLPNIQLDADRFKLALMNVIVNAADAMPRGGTLEIKTVTDGESMQNAQTEACALLEICDDGIGIDPAMLERVFDPFVSTKRDGVGLGLVNARSIVETHGGRIQLARRNAGGTQVRITLPIGQEAHG